MQQGGGELRDTDTEQTNREREREGLRADRADTAGTARRRAGVYKYSS